MKLLKNFKFMVHTVKIVRKTPSDEIASPASPALAGSIFTTSAIWEALRLAQGPDRANYCRAKNRLDSEMTSD